MTSDLLPHAPGENCLRARENNYLVFHLELIITSGGENVAPVPIEARIKAEVPFLSNVMVIGDKRKYLSCVVTLKVCTQLPSHGRGLGPADGRGYIVMDVLLCSVWWIWTLESPRMSCCHKW